MDYEYCELFHLIAKYAVQNLLPISISSGSRFGHDWRICPLDACNEIIIILFTYLCVSVIECD